MAPETPPALNREFEDKLALTVIRRGASGPVSAGAGDVGAGCDPLRKVHERRASGPVAPKAVRCRAGCHRRHRVSWCGEISPLPVRSCSCCGWGKFWRSGTTEKSGPDLASAMSLRIENAWQQVDGTEVLTKVTDVKLGDRIVLRAAAQYLHIGHRPEKHDRSVGGRKYTEEKCALSAFLFCAS